MALKEIKFKVPDDTIAKDILKVSLNRELMLLKKSLSETKDTVFMIYREWSQLKRESILDLICLLK